jgi:hypothetical protein
VSAEVELLELLTALRATLVGVNRVLRSVPGASKAHERILAGMFEDASALEREVMKLVSVERV